MAECGKDTCVHVWDKKYEPYTEGYYVCRLCELRKFPPRDFSDLVITVIFTLLIGAVVATFYYAPKPAQPNQEIREKLFFDCLSKLPEGPKAVANSNDWDEVVSECGTQALYLSYGRPSH